MGLGHWKLIGFANVRYHHGIFQSSCLEIDYISGAELLEACDGL